MVSYKFLRPVGSKRPSAERQYPEGFNGTVELAFDVPTFADVDKEYQEPWGQRTCYVADLDGNLIEIGSFMK